MNFVEMAAQLLNMDIWVLQRIIRIRLMAWFFLIIGMIMIVQSALVLVATIRMGHDEVTPSLIYPENKLGGVTLIERKQIPCFTNVTCDVVDYPIKNVTILDIFGSRRGIVLYITGNIILLTLSQVMAALMVILTYPQCLYRIPGCFRIMVSTSFVLAVWAIIFPAIVEMKLSYPSGRIKTIRRRFCYGSTEGNVDYKSIIDSWTTYYIDLPVYYFVQTFTGIWLLAAFRELYG